MRTKMYELPFPTLNKSDLTQLTPWMSYHFSSSGIGWYASQDARARFNSVSRSPTSGDIEVDCDGVTNGVCSTGFQRELKGSSPASGLARGVGRVAFTVRARKGDAVAPSKSSGASFKSKEDEAISGNANELARWKVRLESARLGRSRDVPNARERYQTASIDVVNSRGGGALRRLHDSCNSLLLLQLEQTLDTSSKFPRPIICALYSQWTGDMCRGHLDLVETST